MASCADCEAIISRTAEFICDECNLSFCRDHYHGHECDPPREPDGVDPDSDPYTSFPNEQSAGQIHSESSNNQFDRQDTVYCSTCGEEIRREAEVCTNCGVKNNAGSGKETTIGKTGYIIMGVITALIALIFVPIVFGAISIFSGVQVYQRWDEKWGILIIILGGVCLAFGVIIGAFVGAQTF